MARLSVDIGGTFTDVALQVEGRVVTTKVLTTYVDPANGVMSGIDEVIDLAGIDVGEIANILHGTTLATNALIERRGAKTALLTTRGHRDILEMAFENRFEQYDVNIDRPEPLVPRHLRIGITERVASDGEVLQDLDMDQLRESVEVLIDDGVESIAVGFLHSYINGHHEKEVGAYLRQRYPQLAVTLSSEVCPEIREYERLSTTVANAYVQPLMSAYLESLRAQLVERGLGCQVLMMTSGGGLTTIETAQKFPIRLVESGPAGGAMLAAYLAKTGDLSRVLSYDMGGTTAKICLIDDAAPLHSRAFEVDRRYRFKKGSGLPVRIPVIEMVEIGAGGGSIAQVDSLQRIQVGPESAGSEPGPACYGRGGAYPTVTDSDVVLGKLPPKGFAGGKFELDQELSNEAVHNHVGAHLDLNDHQAAHAIGEIVSENMAAAARAHASEWGKSLSDRTLIAFGGAAPVHAVALAKKLKIGKVLVPVGAGVGSALGFLLAPIKFEVVRSYFSTLDKLDLDLVDALFKEMRLEATGIVESAVVGGDLSEARQAFMRYEGQGYEVAVDLSPNFLSERSPEGSFDSIGRSEQTLDIDSLVEKFETKYTQLYGRTIPGMRIEVLSWTLAVSAEVTHGAAGGKGTGAGTAGADREFLSLGASPPSDALQPDDAGSPTVKLFDGQNLMDAPTLRRDALVPGFVCAGPAIVSEDQTTTVIPQDATVEVLDDRSLLVRLSDSGAKP